VIGDTLPLPPILHFKHPHIPFFAKASCHIPVIDVGLLWRIGPNIIHTSIHPLPSVHLQLYINQRDAFGIFLLSTLRPHTYLHSHLAMVPVHGVAQVSFFLLAYAYLILHIERGAVLSPIPLGQWGDRKFPSLQF